VEEDLIYMKMAGRGAVLAVMSVAHSLNHSIFLVLPPLLLLIVAETGIPLGTLGLIASLGYLSYGVGALFGGYLSDKLGEVRVISLCLLFSGISVLVMMLWGDLLGFAISFLLMSGWASLYHPAANSFLSKAFPGKMAASMGLHGVGGSIGQVFAPVFAAFVGIRYGWRYPFLALAALSVVSAILMSRVGVETSATGSEHSSKTKLSELFRIPDLRKVFLFNISTGLFFRGIELFFPTYLAQVKGFSIEAAALASSLVLGVGILGQYVGGRGTDRFGARNVILGSAVGVSAGLVLLQYLPFSLSSVGLFIGIYGVGIFASQPAGSALAGLVTPKDKRGFVYGILFFLTFGLGSFSAWLATVVVNQSGLDAAFQIMWLLSLTSIVAALVLPKVRTRDEGLEPPVGTGLIRP
jgi:MFS family permease